MASSKTMRVLCQNFVKSVKSGVNLSRSNERQTTYHSELRRAVSHYRRRILEAYNAVIRRCAERHQFVRLVDDYNAFGDMGFIAQNSGRLITTPKIRARFGRFDCNHNNNVSEPLQLIKSL